MKNILEYKLFESIEVEILEDYVKYLSKSSSWWESVIQDLVHKYMGGSYFDKIVDRMYFEKSDKLDEQGYPILIMSTYDDNMDSFFSESGRNYIIILNFKCDVSSIELEYSYEVMLFEKVEGMHGFEYDYLDKFDMDDAGDNGKIELEERTFAELIETIESVIENPIIQFTEKYKK